MQFCASRKTAMLSLQLFAVLLAAVPRSNLAVEVNDSSVQEDTDKLQILRCCRPGEDLEASDAGPGADARCVPSSQSFAPLIYSPEVGNFLPEPPSNWHFLENARPRCLEPQELGFVPHNQNNPFVLFASGQVLIETGGGEFLGPDEYCLGSSSLLACQSRRNESLLAADTARPKIRKCCGENAAYNSEK